MADFKQIKRDIPIESVIPLLDLHLKPQGRYLKGPCPTCSEKGGDLHLSIRPDWGTYKCYKSGEDGSVINLVAHINDMSPAQAGAWLEKQFTREPVRPEKKSEEGRSVAPTSPKGFDPLTYEERLNYEHEKVQSLGISGAEARDMGIGVDSKGKLRVRVTIGGKPFVFPEATLEMPKNWRKFLKESASE